MSAGSVESAVRRLVEAGNGRSSPRELRSCVDELTGYLRDNAYTTTSIRSLGALPDDVKMLVVQQNFQHTRSGTHHTEYDREAVSRLLSVWFDLDLGPGEAAVAAPDRALPGRAGVPPARVDLGGTELFLTLTGDQDRAARDLVRAVADRAVLTTAATSPPCAIAEFVPRWLQERDRPAADHYLDGGPDHPIAAYFDRQLELLADGLGVHVLGPSTEMGIVANGDGLRYHRDRLVNQYAELERSGAAADLSLVQDLTLIDWDMQAGTMSATAFDHPDGDRYLLVLEPGEVLGMFFAEPPRFPGPMMMPFHCALPVFDRGAGSTVGAAKGKRLGALTRGLAATTEVDALRSRAVPLRHAVLATGTGPDREYTDGLRIGADPLPEPVVRPVSVLDGDAEGLTVLELDPAAAQRLPTGVAADPARTRVFRLVKHGTGFSDPSRVVPGLADAATVVIVARSPGRDAEPTARPVALDHTGDGLPWLRLLPQRTGRPMWVPRALRTRLRLTPTDEILHRSALLDSFQPAGSKMPRPCTVVDVIVGDVDD